MDLEKKFLQENTSTCMYPILDPTTKKRKHLCGMMTYRENGKLQPFCKEHLEEIRKILALKKTQKNKKRRGFVLKSGR